MLEQYKNMDKDLLQQIMEINELTDQKVVREIAKKIQLSNINSEYGRELVREFNKKL